MCTFFESRGFCAKGQHLLGILCGELEYLEEMPAFNRGIGFSANQINRKLPTPESRLLHIPCFVCSSLKLLGGRSELSKLFNSHLELIIALLFY